MLNKQNLVNFAREIVFLVFESNLRFTHGQEPITPGKSFYREPDKPFYSKNTLWINRLCQPGFADLSTLLRHLF